MRVAIVSDVHGNLPAFEAVLAELEQRGPFDALVGGGDYISGGAYPHECLALYRSDGWACVRGNSDEWVVQYATEGRWTVDLEHVDPAMRHTENGMTPLDAWIAARLTTDDVDFLSDLPLVWRTTGPSGEVLAFAHATPWSAHPIYLPDMSEADAQALLDSAEADAYLYGHIHRPYEREVDGHLIGCVGAVGFGLDGDNRPCFGIATDDGEGWSLEHVRVDYDNDQYADTLEQSGMPTADGMAVAVRTGSR